jgi:hypothetical protein
MSQQQSIGISNLIFAHVLFRIKDRDGLGNELKCGDEHLAPEMNPTTSIPKEVLAALQVHAESLFKASNSGVRC